MAFIRIIAVIRVTFSTTIDTVGGQIKLGHLNLICVNQTIELSIYLSLSI
jgi:hypothetical protein